MAEQAQAPERERPHVKITEESPRWQQVLAEHAGWRHLTEQADPPVKVEYYSNRLEVPNVQARVAKRLYAILIAIMPSQGFVVERQVVGVRPGLTVHIDGI